MRTTYKWLTRARVGGRHARLTGWAIAVRLQLPRSTVAAVLARQGLNRLRRLDPAPPGRRCEGTHPRELVHMT